MIKNYNVSLDEEVVERLRKILNTQGKKLSPILNLYLIELIKKEEKKIGNK